MNDENLLLTKLLVTIFKVTKNKDASAYFNLKNEINAIKHGNIWRFAYLMVINHNIPLNNECYELSLEENHSLLPSFFMMLCKCCDQFIFLNDILERQFGIIQDNDFTDEIFIKASLIEIFIKTHLFNKIEYIHFDMNTLYINQAFSELSLHRNIIFSNDEIELIRLANTNLNKIKHNSRIHTVDIDKINIAFNMLKNKKLNLI